MLALFNPSTIFNAVLVLSVGLVVVRVTCIASALIECLIKSKTKE